ncbi:Nramp family divalent metal transporter [Nocardiopsis halophila]|uniref:Nramp family divalent metal transporter n=1 Tax=Nocardiopsis halophila TaxID=141692 RepID=UPI0003478180|nr:Nramp family divalent metal transporter [Nocardiopsis halophila]
MSPASEPLQPSGEAELRSLDEDAASPPDLRGLRALRYIGPGLLMAMAGIGTSHLVTAPVAGANFEYALLWVLPVAFLFKWQGFELAVRYTAATGESVIAAYARVPGPRKWAVWALGIATLIIGCTAVGAIVAAAAAVLWAWIGAGALVLYGIGLSLLIVGLLLSGRYRALEAVNKVLAVVLVLGTVVAFVFAGVQADSLLYMVLPVIPAGSALMIAGLMGWMPTDLTVGVWGSLWMKDRRKGMVRIREVLGDEAVEDTPEQYRPYADAWFKAALYDFRIGHIVSWVIATMYLLLGAAILFDVEEKPEGAATVLAISGIFTETVGAWMFPVFLLGAFAALFSTAFIIYDGFPRALAAAATTVFPPRADRPWWNERNAGLGMIALMLVCMVIALTVLPDPAWLVPAAGTVSFAISPVLFAINLYVALNFIPRRYRPGRFGIVWSWISVVVLTLLTVWVVPQTLGLF